MKKTFKSVYIALILLFLYAPIAGDDRAFLQCQQIARGVGAAFR